MDNLWTVDTDRLLDVEQLHSTAHVAELTGVSYRMLDYWTRHGVVAASGRQAKGSGCPRLWTDADVSRVALVRHLTELGARLDVCARVLEQLDPNPERWPGWLFVGPDGAVTDVHPRWSAWWGIATARIRRPQLAAA